MYAVRVTVDGQSWWSGTDEWSNPGGLPFELDGKVGVFVGSHSVMEAYASVLSVAYPSSSNEVVPYDGPDPTIEVTSPDGFTYLFDGKLVS